MNGYVKKMFVHFIIATKKLILEKLCYFSSFIKEIKGYVTTDRTLGPSLDL